MSARSFPLQSSPTLCCSDREQFNTTDTNSPAYEFGRVGTLSRPSQEQLGTSAIVSVILLCMKCQAVTWILRIWMRILLGRDEDNEPFIRGPTVRDCRARRFDPKLYSVLYLIYPCYITLPCFSKLFTDVPHFFDIGTSLRFVTSIRDARPNNWNSQIFYNPQCLLSPRVRVLGSHTLYTNNNKS